MKGISRRWFVNTVGIILVILVVFITVLSFTVQSYSYNSIRQVLKGRVDELLNVLSAGSSGYKTSSEFNAAARDYIENFPDKNSMEIMAISRTGRIFITSTGFAPNTSQQMPDHTQAVESADNYGYWVGKLDTGEKAMAVTRVVRDSEDNILGSVRYIVSMEKVDRQIYLIISVLIGISILIMLVIFLSGAYFIRSIVVPVRKISVTAKQIAQGDFEVRVDKMKDDEIGQLCESINDMAGELGASERMKNDFISSVSHELRTPLTSIKGWAETLQDGADKETTGKGMQVIIKESERLSGIVEELLDFSRLQSGRLQLNMKKVDIISELDEVVFLFTDRARTEKKELHYDEVDMLPPIVGDANKLRQVFVNIIDNALKYTDEGGSVTIQAGETEGFIVVSVSDTGCGIPEEHLQNVKKKFYKANQLVRGSGIGLAVADEIVALHQGKLEIESHEDIGTMVTISFPTLKHIEENPALAVLPETKKLIERNTTANE